MNFSPGGTFQGYLLEHELRPGGMGVVWAARDTRTGRRTALKILRSREAKAPGARERFLREARATRAIAHPAIVPVTEILDCAGMPVLVMDLLHGETFGDRLRRSGCLELASAARVIVAVADAVAAAHAVGIVHRDLKPHNVFLEADAGESVTTGSRVRVLDFGVARFQEPLADTESQPLTALNSLVGTIEYMSPEQALRPSECGHGTDIWALGAMLYESLSGCRPIEAATKSGALRQLLIAAITPIGILAPELPVAVSDLVTAMLSRSPERRPASMAEVARVLTPYAAVPSHFG